jgi:hypothetical protein
MTTDLRPVPEYPGLLASDDGGLFRHHPDGTITRLKETVRQDGYHVINFKLNGKWGVRLVHRLVAAAWYGAPENSRVVTRHRDDNRGNNVPSNLLFGLQADNVFDMMRAGRVRKGDKHPHARLTALDVGAIKHALAMKVSYRVIATHWCVSRSTIADISQGRTWKDVPPAGAVPSEVPAADRGQSAEPPHLVA